MNSEVLPDEVIVVNDGGDPILKEMLADIPKRTKLIYARINEDIPWNYNGACNLGVWLSTGDLLAFEDNDNIPKPDYYKKAIDYFRNNDVDRAVSKVRHLISEEDILTKPSKEWEIINTIGPNQGTAIIRRNKYLKLKGHDESFCGRYGWMYYDWRRRMLSLGVKFGTVPDSSYWYCDKVQTGLSHHPDPQNYGILRRNTKLLIKQSSKGILNFTYEYEELR
jgi:hypothetical protein